MQNRHGAGRYLGSVRDRPSGQAQDVGANIWRVSSIVASIQRRGQLAEDAPNKTLLSPLSLERQILDDSTEVTVAAVLHVQM